jgi:hypothetical protein
LIDGLASCCDDVFKRRRFFQVPDLTNLASQLIHSTTTHYIKHDDHGDDAHAAAVYRYSIEEEVEFAHRTFYDIYEHH